MKHLHNALLFSNGANTNKMRKIETETKQNGKNMENTVTMLSEFHIVMHLFAKPIDSICN